MITKIKKWTEEHHVIAQVRVYKDDNLIIDITESNKLFRIGSVTKTFISSLVDKLIDTYILSLHDRLDKWYPQIEYSKDITLESLINMRSGISNYTEYDILVYQYYSQPYQEWDPDELINVAISNIPGSFCYSNTNYIIIGRIIEMVTNKPLHKVIKNKLLHPEGLYDTYLKNTLYNIPTNRLVRGYTYDRGYKEDATNFNCSFAWSSGAIISSMNDLKKWSDIYLTKKKPLDKDIKKYCHGYVSNNSWVSHSGSLPGYSTVLAYLDTDNTTIIISIDENRDGYNLADHLWLYITELLELPKPIL